MVYTCAVPGCSTGYNGTVEPGVSLHSFPSDEEGRRKWVRLIHREGFTPSKYSKVCSLHFHSSDFLETRVDTNPNRREKRGALVRKKLKSTAFPSVFPNLPCYLSSPSPSVRPTHRATSSSRRQAEVAALEQQEDTFMRQNIIDCLADLSTNFACEMNRKNFTLYFESEEFLLFTCITTDDIPSCACVKVMSNLDFSVSIDGKNVPPSIYAESMEFSKRILRYSDFLNLLSAVNNHKESPSSVSLENVCHTLRSFISTHDVSAPLSKQLVFLLEQLEMLMKAPSARRYSKSLLVTSLLLHSRSPSCYRMIRNEGILCLPSERLLRSLSSGFDVHNRNDSMLRYLKLRRKKLNVFESTVSLVFDEIHVFQTVEFSRHRFVGLVDDSDSPAKTVLCFMLKSHASKYCDVIALFPISTLNVVKLNQCFMSCLRMSFEAGFDVVMTICDNHVVNRTFLTNFLCDGSLSPVTKNPITGEKLFLLIDPTHTFKNIYNIFQKRNNFVVPGTDDITGSNPSFSHLHELG